MSFLTTLTRMWLTRSHKPFIFKNEYDEQLPFSDSENLGLYIHIPFCRSICSFCPYCKTIYSKELCDKYIDALIKEIHLVGEQTPAKKEVTGLYFGGGTPALASQKLKDIITAAEEHFNITEGIGVELHPDNITPDILELLKAAGVTKISIGIQSFSPKFQKLLGRTAVNPDKIKAVLDKFNFETVSMDFIFALPEQNFEDLKEDIDTAFSIGANHIAIYPFIDFSFAKSGICSMPKKEKRALLDAVTAYCEEKGYSRNSIWTFSAKREAEYSSMTRDNFLGFGCSATTLLKEQFKINTFSVSEYIKRIELGRLPTSLTLRFSKRQRMLYYLFWTAYSTEVNEKDFEDFFGVSLKRMFGTELWLARLFGFVTKKDGKYKMTARGAFYYHHFEGYYTLAYIDKMWGIMRNDAFPQKIAL